MRIRKLSYPSAEGADNRKNKQKGVIGVITLVNALFLLISLLCWTGTYLRNKALNEYGQGYSYQQQGNIVVLDLGDETNVELRFGKSCVKIVDAYRVSTLKDQAQVILFIQDYLHNQDKSLSRKITDCVGEYRLHCKLYQCGYEVARTKDVDLEYERDMRWYVNVCSRLLGFTGL